MDKDSLISNQIKNNPSGVKYNAIYIPESVRKAIDENKDVKRIKKAKILKTKRDQKKYHKKYLKEAHALGLRKKRKFKKIIKSKPEQLKIFREEYDDLKFQSREALKSMTSYYLRKRLDPRKDWKDDKEHGIKIRKWEAIIDKYNYYHNLKKRGELKIKRNKKLKKPTIKLGKFKSKVGRVWTYPLIDGKPMSDIQQRSYRDRLRYLLKSGIPVDIAQKKVLKKVQLEIKYGNLK